MKQCFCTKQPFFSVTPINKPPFQIMEYLTSQKPRPKQQNSLAKNNSFSKGWSPWETAWWLMV